jgi:hypothetical protein
MTYIVVKETRFDPPDPSRYLELTKLNLIVSLKISEANGTLLNAERLRGRPFVYESP